MVEMQNHTPSDLCWNAKFPPEQEWIERAVHVAVGNIWRRAHHVAHAQLGDDSLVPEIMEVAIDGTVRRLETGSPQGPEDVAVLLERLFLQEVRRRRKANNRLVYLDSNQELPNGSAQNPHALVDSAIDLDRILHDIPPDVRIALLLRYSRSRWSEVAAVLGTSEAAVRLRCKRALDRIRRKMEDEIHGT
jgi:hypothetical protein